jgi:hypothetical protein
MRKMRNGHQTGMATHIDFSEANDDHPLNQVGLAQVFLKTNSLLLPLPPPTRSLPTPPIVGGSFPDKIVI